MYLGGKTRIAKPLAQIMLAGRGGRDIYVEPFLGAGAVAVQMAPHFDTVVASDASPDLVMLWNAVLSGWVPPTELNEAEYLTLKASVVPSALRGFAGFPLSFGGKWFGGFARDPKNGRNYADVASRSIRKRAGSLAHATIARQSYEAYDSLVGPDMVIYCDPPYADTTAYGAVGAFDSAAFWAMMRRWSRIGAAVYVSEYDAPSDFEVVWEGNPITSLAGRGGGSTVRERLYRYGV